MKVWVGYARGYYDQYVLVAFSNEAAALEWEAKDKHNREVHELEVTQ